MSKITLSDVTYLYGEGTPFLKTALDHVNLAIEGDAVTGLIGHTGCGKSTLVQLLNGLLKPTEGTVCLDGQDIWAQPKEIGKVRFRVGLVFQYPEYQLFEETVYKDIAFGPRNMGLDESEVDRRVRSAAAFVSLDESLLSQSPFDLSGGQKRRVAIAGVIAMEPEVLILDEPAAGLDPIGRKVIFGGVTAYQKEKHATVLIVSHSMEDMARYADQLIVMKSGKILMTGDCHTVFSQTAKLRDAGLNVPQITSFMEELSGKGLPVRTDIFTVEQAKDELLRLLKEGGKRHAE